MSEKIIRFGIGTPRIPKSTIWKLFVDKSESYLIQGFMRNLSKFSFHSSGKWRFACRSEGWTKIEDRALYKWERPKAQFNSWVLGPTIVFPPIMARDPLVLLEKYDKKIHWLKPPIDNQERIVMIVFSKNETDINSFLSKSNIPVDWYQSLEITDNGRLNADRVWVLSWVESIRDDTKIQVADVLQKLKIHFKKGSSPEGIFGLATPISMPSKQEQAKGLSPTVIEIWLGKDNLEEDKL